MKIKKVFNNNVLLAGKEEKTEIVMMGKGLAFQKRVGDEVDLSKVEKTFILETKGLSEKLAELIQDIPVEHLEISNEIIQYAKKELDVNFKDSVYLALTDHISFAIARYQQGLTIKNALLWEIKKLYKKEFEVAFKALQIIEKETGIKLPEDEAGSIALHFINAQESGSGMDQTMMMTQIANDILNIVKYHYSIELDENSMNYNRFLTHLRYFAYRLQNRELILEEDDDTLYEQLKNKYTEAYRCSQKVSAYLENSYDTTLTKDEIAYFMIHIHRVTNRERKNG